MFHAELRLDKSCFKEFTPIKLFTLDLLLVMIGLELKELRI